MKPGLEVQPQHASAGGSEPLWSLFPLWTLRFLFCGQVGRFLMCCTVAEHGLAHGAERGTRPVHVVPVSPY
jgi:hypothetical protein